MSKGLGGLPPEILGAGPVWVFTIGGNRSVGMDAALYDF